MLAPLQGSGSPCSRFFCSSTVLPHRPLLDELSQNSELPCSAEAAACPTLKPSCASVLTLCFPWLSVGASSRQMLADPTIYRAKNDAGICYPVEGFFGGPNRKECVPVSNYKFYYTYAPFFVLPMLIFHCVPLLYCLERTKDSFLWEQVLRRR